MITTRIRRPITVSMGLIGVSLAITVPLATSASAASQCNTDWRGDHVCIQVQGNQVVATGNDKYSPEATIYLSILRRSNRQVVAGPVGAHTLRATLPPGHYFASYYVQTVDFGGSEVGSPVVRT